VALHPAALAATLVVVTPAKSPWWQQVATTPKQGFFKGVVWLIIALPMWGSATDGRGHLLPSWLIVVLATVATASGALQLAAAVLLRRRRRAAAGMTNGRADDRA
jgi:hypothetical protein